MLPAPHPPGASLDARARLASTVVVGALALAACGGPSKPPPDPPLDDIRAQIEAARPDPRMRWDAIEERISACMAEQGFDYQPVAYGRPNAWQLADPGDLEPGTREFAEQYGYGVLTLTRMTPPEDEAPDPNLERLQEMSPGELPAYTTALWGPLPDPGVDELGLQTITITDDAVDPDADRGCQGEAERAVDAEEAGLAPDIYAELSAEMAALDEEIPDDPRLDGVNARWAACMLGAGYPDLERVGDGEDAVLREIDARFVADHASMTAGTSVDEADRRAHRIQLDMASFEIELALADLQCREDVGYAGELAEVAAERQAEFVTEHRAELDAWLAAIAEEPAA